MFNYFQSEPILRNTNVFIHMKLHDSGYTYQPYRQYPSNNFINSTKPLHQTTGWNESIAAPASTSIYILICNWWCIEFMQLRPTTKLMMIHGETLSVSIMSDIIPLLRVAVTLVNEILWGSPGMSITECQMAHHILIRLG